MAANTLYYFDIILFPEKKSKVVIRLPFSLQRITFQDLLRTIFEILPESLTTKYTSGIISYNQLKLKNKNHRDFKSSRILNFSRFVESIVKLLKVQKMLDRMS